MKKTLFLLLFLAWAGMAQAQCVAKITGVEIDDTFGSVKVLTQYILNGVNVDAGGKACGGSCPVASGRYDESQGTIEEIIVLNEKDRKTHCDVLVYNSLSAESKAAITSAVLAEKKKQNADLKTAFDKEVSDTVTVSEVVQTYKDLTITVKPDDTVSIVDKSNDVTEEEVTKE